MSSKNLIIFRWPERGGGEGGRGEKKEEEKWEEKKKTVQRIHRMELNPRINEYKLCIHYTLS